MDYDQTDIASGYDRGRDHGPEVLELWMNAVESHVERQGITRILDLGCGTGRFSSALAARFDAEVVGVDPSTKMLEQARAKRGDARVDYRLGRAEAIPLPSDSVDLLFISMSFHHFSDLIVAARECRRVLREPGRALVRTGTRERISAYPYVPFFPSTRSMLETLLPDAARVREVFESAGFDFVASELVTQPIASGWGPYADKLAVGGDSVLARLGRDELDAGLAAIRNRTAQFDESLVEPIDLFVFR